MTVLEKDDPQKKQKRDDRIPRLISANAKLYFVIIALVFLAIIQSFWINSANVRAEKNTEIIYVKLYPNGSWDVEYRSSGNETDFFPLTIDKAIQDYVEARYSILPHNMRRQYGFASLYMSPDLKNWFVGDRKGQYNASKVATEFDSSNRREEVYIRFVDHYDVSKGVFVRGNSDIYRTNVFITRTVYKDNVPLEEFEEVVTLHWRIKSANELKGLTRDELRANAIGLEILKDDKVLDISK